MSTMGIRALLAVFVTVIHAYYRTIHRGNDMEGTGRTGPAAAAPAAARAPRRQRGSQASYLENMLVAKSWIAASEDKIVGTSRKGADFTCKHVELYNLMAREAIQNREPGYEQVFLERDVTFPTTQFVKLRKITYTFIAVRKQYPKTSGDNNKEEYYERIRPMVQAALKAKAGVPHSKPEKFEPIVDHLKKYPKFMSYMNDTEKVERPSGKRKSQKDARLEKVRQKVAADINLPTGSAFGGDQNASNPAAASLSGLVHQISSANHAYLAYGIAANAYQQQEQMRGLLAALKPEALPKFSETATLQAPALPPPPAAPAPPPPPAPDRATAKALNVDGDEDDDDFVGDDDEDDNDDE